MISEVDLRDWDKVDFGLLPAARKDPYQSVNEQFEKFHQQVMEVYQKQIQSIPALLRKQ